MLLSWFTGSMFYAIVVVYPIDNGCYTPNVPMLIFCLAGSVRIVPGLRPCFDVFSLALALCRCDNNCDSPLHLCSAGRLLLQGGERGGRLSSLSACRWTATRDLILENHVDPHSSCGVKGVCISLGHRFTIHGLFLGLHVVCHSTCGGRRDYILRLPFLDRRYVTYALLLSLPRGGRECVFRFPFCGCWWW